jgi:hypothetical protein
MALSPNDAAFEGIRLTRENPRLALWWMAPNLLVNALLAALIVATVGKDLGAVDAFLRDPLGPTAAMDDGGAGAVLFELVAGPLMIAYLAVLSCAAYRAVFTPADSRFGYLRLGMDEARVAGLFLVLALIFSGVLIVGSVLAVLVFGGLVSIGGPVAGMLAMAFAITVLIGAMIYFGVRLSLAGPMSFAERRIAIASAWRLTRGHFWPLLGAYFLSWAAAVVVNMLATAVFMGVAAAATGDLGAYGQAERFDFTTMAGLFTPGHLLFLVASSLLGSLQALILLTPPAVAFRALGGAARIDTLA